MKKNILSMIVGALLSISAIDTSAQEGNHVVGGETAENKYPFFVSLTEPQSPGAPYYPFCGGSLIRPQWVLTAAHCVVDFLTEKNYDSLDVLVNIYSVTNPNNNHERITSDYIVRHPWFDPSGMGLLGDVALIHLKTASTFETIQLIDANTKVYEIPNADVQIIGFGVYDTTDIFQSPDTLQIAEIKVVSNEIANEPARYDGSIDTTMICAGKLNTQSKGAGAGDSGGPLFNIDQNGNEIQIGVVSFGQGFYTTGTHPGVYSRVSAFRKWIDDTIEAYEQSTGVDKTKAESYRVFNSGDFIQVQLEKSYTENIQLEVYSLNGQKVLSSSIPAQENLIRFNCSTWNKGLYIVKLYSEGKTFESHKIIR